MAVSKEAIDRILCFDPGRVVVEGQRIDLGEIDSDKADHTTRVVYGNYAYQRRLVTGNRVEPLLFGTTVQPIVALETRDNKGQLVDVRKLAYATDVRGLDDSIARQVLDRINIVHLRRELVAA